MGSRDKKRHRLEKGLANSAAIISELEKKKQKKKEEQERLDEEGTSVALHVLIGEDCDESRHLALNKHRRCNERRVLSPRSAGPKKQVEKKRRLLEKALATSAAIISELEKKQKKKEEQERLDEEGASISEAVALHVLIGEESDESRHLALSKHRRCEGRVLSPRSAGPKKQAEKKRRLLEKALATSAAIISELEKKKQKQKEEQERLDEEGASISEAGSLHVLIDDDSDESRHLVLNKHKRCNNWDPSAGFDFTLDAEGAADIYSPGGLMCANQAYASKGRWIDCGNAHPLPKGEVRELKASCYQGTFHQSTVACPAFMAAQALSSLQIRED